MHLSKILIVWKQAMYIHIHMYIHEIIVYSLPGIHLQCMALPACVDACAGSLCMPLHKITSCLCCHCSVQYRCTGRRSWEVLSYCPMCTFVSCIFGVDMLSMQIFCLHFSCDACMSLRLLVLRLLYRND